MGIGRRLLRCIQRKQYRTTNSIPTEQTTKETKIKQRRSLERPLFFKC